MSFNEEILFYAFRYALGRMTYAVSTVSGELINNWHRISDHTKELIIDEINKAIKSDNAGAKCDVVRWKSVLLLENAVKESNQVNSPTGSEEGRRDSSYRPVETSSSGDAFQEKVE